jgi:hypothetical protein
MKNKKTLLFLVLVVFLLSTTIFLISLFSKPKILEKKELFVYLTVGDTTGFNISKDSINFGVLSSGNAGSRDDVFVKNNYNFSIDLNINIDGNVSSFVLYDKIVNLKPGEEKNIGFSTIKITNESYGLYYGKMTVLFIRAS